MWRWALLPFASALIVGLLFALDPTHILRGLLCGDEFYGNRPATYWRMAIIELDDNRQATPSIWGRFACSCGITPSSQESRYNVRKLLDDPTAFSVLTVLTTDDDLYVRWKASEALIRMSLRDSSDLIVILEESVYGLPDYDDRLRALELLEALGPRAAPASAGLVRALADKGNGWSYFDEEPLYERAARVLLRIGPPAIPALQNGLKSDNCRARELASRVLAQLDVLNED